MHGTEMEIKNPSENVKGIALVEGTPGEEKTPFVLIGKTRKVGGRPRASGSREASQSSVSEEGMGCEAEKRAVQAEQGGPVGTMAVHVFSHENPRVTDKDSVMI
nr:hypothetical protein CFP56_68502 [Quercus suber]